MFENSSGTIVATVQLYNDEDCILMLSIIPVSLFGKLGLLESCPQIS